MINLSTLYNAMEHSRMNRLLNRKPKCPDVSTPNTLNSIIHNLVQNVQECFPDARFTIDGGNSAPWQWFVDVEHKTHVTIMAWNPKQYSITCYNNETFEQWDEIYPDLMSAYNRMMNILTANSKPIYPLQYPKCSKRIPIYVALAFSFGLLVGGVMVLICVYAHYSFHA